MEHQGTRPLVWSWLSAVGLTSLVQSALLLDRYGPLGSPGGEGLRRVGLAALSAWGTLLVLVPVMALLALLLRRWGVEPRCLPWAVGMAVAVWVSVDLLATPGSTPTSGLFHGLLTLVGFGAGLGSAPRGRWAEGFFVGLAVLGVVLGGMGLARGGGAPETPPHGVAGAPRASDEPPGGRPDVVLVTVDTLRADRLSAWGRSPSITPNLDRLGEEGVVLRRVMASSPWTVPSVASLMTSLPTLEHGAGLPVGSGQTFLRTGLGEEHRTLAERFERAGYRTAAVVANAFLGPGRGLDQGFEHYENPWLEYSRIGIWLDLPFTRWLIRRLPAESFGDPRARGMVDRGLELLADDDPRPLFLWLHLIDPHAPYLADPDRLEIVNVVEELASDPRPGPDGSVVGERFVHAHQVRGGVLWLGPEDRRRIEAHYDRGVKYADEHLGRLFEALRQRHAVRPVITAVTADHGEEFWDHGHFEHGHDYYDEVIRVPTMLWSPGRVPAATVVEEAVGLVDLGPTLADLAGLPTEDKTPEWWQGWSLVGLWSESHRYVHPPRLAGGNLYGLPAVALEDGPWRYILRANGVEELYHLPSDPAEHHNVRFLQPDTAALYRKILEPRLAAHLAAGSTAGAPLDSTDLEGLRSLGYVQ